ncbi:MAG TPA: hypothetical protein VFW98_08190 [Gemmatimonadaceae bacterium]|nr:hypothetical protein [Gemmatimonadaceae bacterium]
MSVRPTPALRAMLVPTEHQEQVALFAWAGVMAARYPELDEMFAVPNAGGYKGGYGSNRLLAIRAKREGVKPGIEDVMLLVARGGWHGLLMELKRVDATPSDVKQAQRTWHKRHALRGFRVEVCKGAEAAEAVLLDYLALPVTRVSRAGVDG